jgi:hypothetical protein
MQITKHISDLFILIDSSILLNDDRKSQWKKEILLLNNQECLVLGKALIKEKQIRHGKNITMNKNEKQIFKKYLNKIYEDQQIFFKTLRTSKEKTSLAQDQVAENNLLNLLKNL